MIDGKLISTILAQNKQREEMTLSAEACPSSRGRRITPETDPGDIRSSFSRDTDRIIHSSAYTRYIDKTQVFSLFENDNITRRVLHVQLVSKIARMIGRALRLNEDLIEAIALGHDLGHVPYGHDGERYLNALCEEQNIGYFAHNAQSMRTLLELENNGRGLNLTIQVLDGILCHNGEMLEEVYLPDPGKDEKRLMEEYRACFSEKNSSRKIRSMTLEGCVVRISDVIAYIGRDIEDAITLGLLNREELPEDCSKLLGSRNDRIVRTLSDDLIEQSYGKKGLSFSSPVFRALQALLRFNYERIYLNPRKKSEDDKIEKMFRYLYQSYLKELVTRDEESFVYRWASRKMRGEYMEQTPPERIAADYIANMTDRYFNEEFRRRVIPGSYGYKFRS